MKFFYNLFSHLISRNKYWRKNFYEGISEIGVRRYLQLKKQSLCPNDSPFKYNVSIVAIAKNEGIYFKEWIEYHRLIGVDHFYIYNNDSDDDTKEILKPYIEQGIVTYIDFPGKEMQEAAYNDAVDKYKNDTRWLCPLDLDEFIFVKKNNDLKQFMKKFDDCFQVSIRWMMFGSSGYIQRPQGLVIENFIKRAKECSSTPKSIFNPRACINVNRVHYAIGVGKWVDENHCEYGTKCKSVNDIQINHYFIKSKEEFVNRKTARGSNKTRLTIKDIEGTFNENDYKDITDTSMYPYAEKLKQIMKF